MSINVMFSVNEYDSDGDILESGVFIHFGDARILVAESIEDYQDFCNKLLSMREEISAHIG